MEASTTIRKMMAGNRIIVPSYQRAYSWVTPTGKTKKITQVDVFLSDLEEYSESHAKSPYYFGHFLFEDKGNEFHVIDGQQRLTTIVIFLSALFSSLSDIRKLNDEEEECYEDMVKRRRSIRFSTVDYDNQLFVDYVIEKTKTDHNSLETESSKRIVRAFDYFRDSLAFKPESYLTKMLSIVSESTCTTHPVKNESEAIQMFIFQNNRGKKPSNLEVLKAQFMYAVHLHGGDEKELLIKEIKGRFENIYKSISSIEYRLDEDDILVYTMRVHFNSLWESSTLDKIEKMLNSENAIDFISDFTRSLSVSFGHLSTFFGKHERENFDVHSLVSLDGIAIAIPFIIKSYLFGLPLSDIGKLCSSLEGLLLRHRLIGTRADMTSRVNGVFEAFTESNKDITPILARIESMKSSSDWWWAYWSDDKLEESLQGSINHSVAKYLLWKYEVHLESLGKSGYCPTRFDQIIKPELEHISPTTEPPVKPHGYGEYDEDFINRHLNCLGNYLLLSKSHNCAVGNVRFSEKHKTYNHNKQQREIQDWVPETGIWDKTMIETRKKKIIQVIMKNC